MRRALTIGLPCLLLAVLIAGYTAAWFAACRYLGAGFEAWVAHQRSAGWQVETGTPVRGGWPLAATLTVPGVALEAGAEGVPGRVSWHAAQVVLSLTATSPDRLGVDLGGAQSLRVAPGPEVTFSAERMHVEVPLGRGTPARAASLEVRGLRAQGPIAGAIGAATGPADGPARGPSGGPPSATAGGPEGGPAAVPATGPVGGPAAVSATGLVRGPAVGATTSPGIGLAGGPAPVPATLAIGLLTGQIVLGDATKLTLSAEAIDLPPEMNWALGSHISSVAVDATVRGGVPPPGPLPAMFAAWRDAGGAVDVTHFALGWGPLGVAATGQAGFDEHLQPAGTADVHVIGYAKAVDALAKQHVISKDAALAATAVLTLMSRAPQDGGAPEVQVPLTLRNRMVLMGKTPLLRVPEVVWPHG